MLLENLLLAKKLIEKLEKSEDLVELKEVLGLFDFPETLKNTVKDLKHTEDSLIKKSIKVAKEYLSDYIDKNYSKRFDELDETLLKFENLTNKLIEIILDNKVYKTDEFKDFKIHLDKFLTIPGILTLAIKFNKRLTILESKDLKDATLEVMLEALRNYKTESNTAKDFILMNSNIKTLKEFDTDITTITLIKVEEILEGLLKEKENVDKILENIHLNSLK